MVDKGKRTALLVITKIIRIILPLVCVTIPLVGYPELPTYVPKMCSARSVDGWRAEYFHRLPNISVFGASCALHVQNSTSYRYK